MISNLFEKQNDFEDGILQLRKLLGKYPSVRKQSLNISCYGQSIFKRFQSIFVEFFCPPDTPPDIETTEIPKKDTVLKIL